MTNYPYPDARVKLYPPVGYVYCPRHRTWEPIVEDNTLCDWCCAPREWCLLHDEEWANEPEVKVQVREPPKLRERDDLNDEAIIVDMTEA